MPRIVRDAKHYGRLPEGAAHRWDAGDFEIYDDGCLASPSCFTCPLPDCIWEATVAAITQKVRQHDPALRAMIWADAQAGMNLVEITARASAFNGKALSPTLVNRTIKEERRNHVRVNR